MSSCEQKDFINKHFQNPATFCLFPGFESQIVYVITDVVLVFALLLAAENSSDYSVSRGISVFKPCWQLSPEKRTECWSDSKIQGLKERCLEVFVCDLLISIHAYGKYLRGK